jgi:hypothetical protein
VAGSPCGAGSRCAQWLSALPAPSRSRSLGQGRSLSVTPCLPTALGCSPDLTGFGKKWDDCCYKVEGLADDETYQLVAQLLYVDHGRRGPRLAPPRNQTSWRSTLRPSREFLVAVRQRRGRTFAQSPLTIGEVTVVWMACSRIRRYRRVIVRKDWDVSATTREACRTTPSVVEDH